MNIIGGGWTFTGPGPCPSAVGVMLDVPWDQSNTKHTISLDLMTADGQAVEMPDGPVRAQGEFEVGRPPGHPAGVDLFVPMAFIIPPLPLTPGARYEWRLNVNGETRDEWSASFSVRPPQVPHVV